MNVVHLVGNLGADVETRTTGGGMVIGTIRLATEDRVKKGDEWVKETQWHRVVVFGKTAESCAQFLRKGSKVAVTGKINYREWEADGVKKYMTEIKADFVEFLSPKAEGSGGGGGKSTKGYEQPDDDDIPFN